MEEKYDDAQIATILKNVFDKTSEGIQNDAIVNRALTDKITLETINHKVNGQMNAISIGMRNINPKFNEKSKNYDVTKAAIVETLTNYEAALVALSEFYDGKIEQLILRKVELESHLLGSIVKDEYLIRKEEKKVKPKEKDENTKKIEKEIRLINDEIKRMNERKEENLFNAMEVGDKWVATTIKKPKTFTKIKRFFASKFNTPKLILKTIIEPLNTRIEEFVNNELANIKG